MAEFAASIIALTSTGIKISDGLYGLIKALKDAPDDVLAVANEVSDLNLVLQTAKPALLKGSSELPQAQIKHLLQRANRTYAELQQLISRLHTGLSEGYFGRLIWLREKSNTRRLHKRLRTIRIEAVSLVAIETLTVTRMAHTDIHELRQEVSTALLQVQPVQAAVPAKANDKKLLPDDGKTLVSKSEKDWNALELPVYHTPRRPVCSTACSCDCHRNTTLHLANRFLGGLFFHYNCVPFAAVKCNERGCARRSNASFQSVYYFPRWLFQYALYMMIHSSTTYGPQISLAVARIIPAASDTFEHAWTGNLDAMKVLFSNRDATPMDVDDMDGGSYLNYALRSRKFDMAKFLLELPGTNASLEDQFGESPVDVAWQLVLSRKTEATFDAWLKSQMASAERLRGRHFTTMHKIICGLCKHDLEQELATSTADIDTPDAGGWTPLIWAAYCQDWRSLRLLLEHGANANIANRKGQLALHHACREGLGDGISKECLYTISWLAAATGDLNRKDVYGDTALMYAAEHSNDPRILEVLHKAGASLSETDHTGHTALHIPIYFDNAGAVETLVRLGTDINRTSSGDTPLMKAVICNAHKSMRSLLRLGASVTTIDLEEQTIFHLAALHADAETLQILISEIATLGKVDPGALNKKDHTADTIFWNSRLVPQEDEAVKAWNELMALAQVEWERNAELEKLYTSWASMESGSTDSGDNSPLREKAEIYHDSIEYL